MEEMYRALFLEQTLTEIDKNEMRAIKSKHGKIL